VQALSIGKDRVFATPASIAADDRFARNAFRGMSVASRPSCWSAHALRLQFAPLIATVVSGGFSDPLHAAAPGSATPASNGPVICGADDVAALPGPRRVWVENRVLSDRPDTLPAYLETSARGESPAPVRASVAHLAQRGVRTQLAWHGMGLHSPEEIAVIAFLGPQHPVSHVGRPGLVLSANGPVLPTPQSSVCMPTSAMSNSPARLRADR
jgi:hypothetical protein